MPNPVDPNHANSGHRKNPNFLAVVAMSAIALLLIFAGALVIVWLSGPHLVPGVQPRNQAALYLDLPGPESGTTPA